MPPCSGYRRARRLTEMARGSRKHSHANTHSGSDDGPRRAPRVIQRSAITATTFMATTSRSVSTLGKLERGCARVSVA